MQNHNEIIKSATTLFLNILLKYCNINSKWLRFYLQKCSWHSMVIRQVILQFPNGVLSLVAIVRVMVHI